MKKICQFLIVFSAVSIVANVSESHEIYLNDGRIINAKSVWEDGDIVKYEKFGAVIGVNKSKIQEIKYSEAPERKSTRASGNGFFIDTDAEYRNMTFNERTNNIFLQIYGDQVEAWKHQRLTWPSKRRHEFDEGCMIYSNKKKKLISNMIGMGLSDNEISSRMARFDRDRRAADLEARHDRVVADQRGVLNDINRNRRNRGLPPLNGHY